MLKSSAALSQATGKEGQCGFLVGITLSCCARLSSRVLKGIRLFTGKVLMSLFDGFMHVH